MKKTTHPLGLVVVVVVVGGAVVGGTVVVSASSSSASCQTQQYEFTIKFKKHQFCKTCSPDTYNKDGIFSHPFSS